MALALLVTAPVIGGSAAAPLPQVPPAPAIASYRIDVRFDPVAKTVTGSGQMTYVNASGDALGEVWLHLYLRAFRRLDTEWMRESGGALRAISARPDALGDIAVTRLALDGADLLASAAVTETLMRVPLPRTIAPGSSVTLDVAWTSKLPRVFARTGYGGRGDTFFMVGQWYPKFAVYDEGAWDTEPWHANSEFFHDFGHYDVRITAPSSYVLAATGTPDGAGVSAGDWTTTRFIADSVSDFAFAASPDFTVRGERVGNTEVLVYYVPEHSGSLKEYVAAANGSIAAYGAWFGAYPHARLSVVDVPDNAAGAGGMEYPMLITAGTLGAPPESGLLSVVVAHEMAHQWFPMQVATNEAREPWLDEGLAEYAALRYGQESGLRLGVAGVGASPALLDRVQYFAAQGLPLTLPAWRYSLVQYSGAVYGKGALGLATMERIVGSDKMRAAMTAYVARSRWKHPKAADFRASLELSLGDQRWFFDEYGPTGAAMDYAVEPVRENRAIVRRLGAVRVPVEIELTYTSGRVVLRQWDGHGDFWEEAAPAGETLVRVRADPARRLQAEIPVTNNSYAADPDWSAAVEIGGRLAYWFQLLAGWLGLFG